MATTEIWERPDSEAFRFVLRRATSAEHAALDAHPAFAALMAGTLNIDGYRRLMGLFHGFYRKHDPIFARACGRLCFDRLGFAYAFRGDVLLGDLTALGGRPGQPSNEPRSLPEIDSSGTLGGALYVIEGSMLGGAILCRTAERLLSRAGIDGLGYWRWCRDAGKERWAMTCRAIEELSACETAREEMIAGARTTFSVFAEWLAAWNDDTRPDQRRSMARC
jgi:heme oxygenase